MFPFVSHYDSEYKTMKTKNQTDLKNFKPKVNLNNLLLFQSYGQSGLKMRFHWLVYQNREKKSLLCLKEL